MVDVSDFHAEKVRAIRAHASQLHGGDESAPATYVASADFIGKLESIDRYHGTLIDVAFGEGFYLREALKVEDPLALFDSPFTRLT